MLMPEKNLFSMLGLKFGSDEHRVRGAYRRMAKKYHPDLNPDNPQAGERFKEIAYAYWILSDPQRKKAYLDANPFLHEDFFRGSAEEVAKTPRTAKVKRQDGKDILVRMYLTLEELAEGVMKKVKIRRRQSCTACEGTGIAGGAKSGICPVCRGSGHVPDFIGSGGDKDTISCRKCGGTGMRALEACSTCEGRGQNIYDVFITVGIPPGSGDQEKIVVRGQGHEGHPGTKPGNLRVVIKQKDHPYFERHGDDLDYCCSLTFLQWLEGVQLRVPSLNGRPIALKIEPCATPEGALKVRGRGMPRKKSGRGDLVVKYGLCVPGNLDKKQKNLLKRLEATDGFTPELDEQGWCRRNVGGKKTS